MRFPGDSRRVWSGPGTYDTRPLAPRLYVTSTLPSGSICSGHKFILRIGDRGILELQQRTWHLVPDRINDSTYINHSDGVEACDVEHYLSPFIVFLQHADELFQCIERSSDGKEGIFIERSMEDTINLCGRESGMKLHAIRKDTRLRFDILTLLFNVKFGWTIRLPMSKFSYRKTTAVREDNAMDQKPMYHLVLDVPGSVDLVHSFVSIYSTRIWKRKSVNVVELAEGAPPE